MEKTKQQEYDFKAIEGLHFGMDEDVYHAIPCLSASGLKLLEKNPSKFWWWSWMNPDKEDNETDARIIGKAFHKRILEGKEAFYQSYARDFSCDRDDLISTSDDIREALRAEKEKNHDLKISFSSKQDGMNKLLKIDPSYASRFFDELKREYEMENLGKAFLSDYIVDRAELSASVIENHPFLKSAFIGGYAEVSCVWYDEKYKQWFKCRYDYLKPSVINDLKTFTRMTNKDIERYLPDVITKYGYNIQATHYLESMLYAKKFAKDGKVFGDVDSDWLEAFASRPCDQFRFIFQQKEEVPNAYEVVYSKQHVMHDTCVAKISIAVDNFVNMVNKYGDGLWADIRAPHVLTDDDYPPWAYE